MESSPRPGGFVSLVFGTSVLLNFLELTDPRQVQLRCWCPIDNTRPVRLWAPGGSRKPHTRDGRGRRRAPEVTESGPDLSVSDLKAQLMEDETEPAKADSPELEKAKRRGRGRPRKAVAADPTQTESPLNATEAE